MKYNQPFGVSDPNAPYSNGNPATGVQGSIPQMEAIEYDQREVVDTISTANLRTYRDFAGVSCAQPTNTDLTQLRKAIEAYARWWVEFWAVNRGIGEAPVDGRIYGRTNSSWIACPPESPADNNYYMRRNNTWVIPPPGPPFPEAPTDGEIYGRKNSAWAIIPPGGGGGGIPEAPYDAYQYARYNGQWKVARPYDNVWSTGDTGYLGSGNWYIQAGNPLAPPIFAGALRTESVESDSSPVVTPLVGSYTQPWPNYFPGYTVVCYVPEYDASARGPATLNVNEMGARNIYRNDGQLLQPGDFGPGVVVLVYGRIVNIGAVEGFFVMGLVRSQIAEITPYTAPPPVGPPKFT
jgi:hypothetical protein